MASVRGSAKNPIYVRDSGSSTVGSRVVAYVSLDDDGGSTERPLDELPAASRAASQRKSNQRGDFIRVSAPFHRRAANSASRNSIRSPSAKPNTYPELIAIDDDEPEVEHRAVSHGSVPSLASHYQPGRTDSLVPQGSGANQVTLSEQKPSPSPIGDRADTNREQTAARRVIADATSTPMRVEKTTQVGKFTTSPGLSDKAHKSGEADVPKVPLKPRAVKRATSPPRRKPDSEQSTRCESRNHADSPGPVPVSNRHTDGGLSSRALEAGKRLSEASEIVSRQQEEDITLTKQARNTLPRNVVSAPIGIGRIDMGGQVSVLTAATPSEPPNAAALESLHGARTSSFGPALLPPDSLETEGTNAVGEYLQRSRSTERRGKSISCIQFPTHGAVDQECRQGCWTLADLLGSAS
jgi:hypothetical protein